MYYLGVFVTGWLVLGFLTGIKLIYVDRALRKDGKIQQVVDNAKTDSEKDFASFVSKKSNILIICTLMGGITFVLDTIGTFTEFHRDVRKFFTRFKSKK